MDSKHFPPLQLEHKYPGSATSLFDAWTLPSVAELWLFQGAEKEVDFIADVKEGGEFHTVDKSGNHSVSHSGHYIKIDRPNELIFSLAVPDHLEGLSEVKVEIKEMPGGCILKFSQKNVDTSRNVEPWQSMLEQIQKILKSPYVITITSDKKEIISAINVVLMQLTGFVISLAEDQINKIPFKDSWTAGQLICHIIKSVTGMASAMGKPGSPATRDVTKKVIGLKQTFLDLTIRMQAPEFIVPETKNYEKDNLIKDLQNCLKQLKEAALAADMSEIVGGLPLGEVTKLEILHFVLYHSQRHLFQMKKITDALKL